MKIFAITFTLFALLDPLPKEEPQKITETQAILLSFKRAKPDQEEPNNQRQERLRLIANAINNSTKVRWQRMLLISVAWHESRFASGVQSCKVKGDNGKAVGLWQSWNAKCDDSLQQWADEAIRHLESSWRYCKATTPAQKVYRGVSLYGTGRTCNHEVARPRLRLWQTLMGVK